jgi:hypothetical protein
MSNSSPHSRAAERTMMKDLNLVRAIEADVERYKRMLEMYRSGQANTGELERGFVENTKETERHLENIIRELEALLRDRTAR